MPRLPKSIPRWFPLIGRLLKDRDSLRQRVLLLETENQRLRNLFTLDSPAELLRRYDEAFAQAALEEQTRKIENLEMQLRMLARVAEASGIALLKSRREDPGTG